MMALTCGPQQICTNSACPGLEGLQMPSDLGCRSQNDVFAAAQAHAGQGWRAWNACLKGVRPRQAQVLDRIRAGLGGGDEPGPGGTAPEPSLIPDLEPAGSGSSQVNTWPVASGIPDTTSEVFRCGSDQDCQGNPDGPYCDLTLGTCHPCVPGGRHCKDASRPVCDEHFGQRSCQSCSQDLDCVAQGRGSFCNKRMLDGQYQPRCEACEKHDHCVSVPGRPYCDRPNHNLPPRCVSCIEDQHCGFAGQSCQNRICVGCSAHDACQGDSACWWWPGEVGRCSTHVLYVDSSGSTDCLVGNGSLARPFCRLDEALARAQDDLLTTVRIRGHHELHQGLVIRSRARVQLVGETRSVLSMLDPDQSLLRVADNAHLSLSRLELLSPNNYALVCRGAKSQVRLSDVRLKGGKGSALALENCALQADRVEIRGYNGFAVRAKDATMRISSSMISGNGRMEHDEGGAFLLKGRARVELEHVTIAGNYAKAKASVLRCEGEDNQIRLRDSIVTRMEAPVATNCGEAGISVQRNWSDVAKFARNQGHLAQDGKALYLLIESPINGDFRLSKPLPESETSLMISSMGRWNPGDSPFDLDGHRWKEGEGYVGADQSTIGQFLLRPSEASASSGATVEAMETWPFAR